MNKEALESVALSVRSLSMDAIQKANSGHPGLPLGCAELGAVLYGEILKHNPADSKWMDRDRFIVSAGHGSMLEYSILHLSGYKISLDDIKSFRQLGSVCPGHPEVGMTDGIEATTGPLGQGLAMAVGNALAESMLAEKFNTENHEVVDPYTYTLLGEGCLMEGVSSEASSFAGTMKLGKLIALKNLWFLKHHTAKGLLFHPTPLQCVPNIYPSTLQAESITALFSSNTFILSSILILS